MHTNMCMGSVIDTANWKADKTKLLDDQFLPSLCTIANKDFDTISIQFFF